jgi:chaperonin cofactor prefoldin
MSVIVDKREILDINMEKNTAEISTIGEDAIFYRKNGRIFELQLPQHGDVVVKVTDKKISKFDHRISTLA